MNWSKYRTEIIVAVIGLVGALGAAIIANWHRLIGGDTSVVAETCRTVEATAGDQIFDLEFDVGRVNRITGQWSVVAERVPYVGPEGHVRGEMAAALERDFAHNKYTRAYPFGALLASYHNNQVWTKYRHLRGPERFPVPVRRVKLCINDKDGLLENNGGTLQVCFGK